MNSDNEESNLENSKMLVCTSCGESGRSGSSFCHKCGAPLEQVQPLTKSERGKQKLIGIIIAIVLADVIGRFASLRIELLRGGISSEFVFSTIISGIILFVMIYFLYFKGNWWAKLLTGSLLIIACLILGSFVLSIITNPVPPFFLLVFISQTLLCGAAGIALFRSEDVETFLREQESKSKRR